VFDLYRLFTKDGCFCDITSKDSKESLRDVGFDKDLVRRIESVKVWTHSSGMLLFDPSIIKDSMSGVERFDNYFLKLALEYRVPIPSMLEQDQRYVA
jgi:hypothetical protein